MNAYPSIEFGTIGVQVWHICVRDNPQMTNQALFADMSRFPNLSELFIWNDNQAGALRIPASSPNSHVALLADGNQYTSVDLTGALRNADSSATVSFRNNQLTRLTITGCVQITEMAIENNRLSADQVDSLLTTLDALGRSRTGTDPQTPLRVDFRGNAAPGPTGRAAAARLAAKGWTIVADELTAEPPPPPDTGEARIEFVTRGPVTRLRCDFTGPATAAWHWSDGTTSPATSGDEVAKSELGDGDHPGFLVISNGSALTRFGAADGGGQGGLGPSNSEPDRAIMMRRAAPGADCIAPSGLGRSMTMITRNWPIRIWAYSLVLAPRPLAAGLDWVGPNLLANPDFEIAGDQGLPKDWTVTATPAGTRQVQPGPAGLPGRQGGPQGRGPGHRRGRGALEARAGRGRQVVPGFRRIPQRGLRRARQVQRRGLLRGRHLERRRRQADRLLARDQLPLPCRGLGPGRSLCPGARRGRAVGPDRQPQQSLAAADRQEHPFHPVAGRLAGSPVQPAAHAASGPWRRSRGSSKGA